MAFFHAVYRSHHSLGEACTLRLAAFPISLTMLKPEPFSKPEFSRNPFRIRRSGASKSSNGRGRNSAHVLRSTQARRLGISICNNRFRAPLHFRSQIAPRRQLLLLSHLYVLFSPITYWACSAYARSLSVCVRICRNHQFRFDHS